MKYLVKNNKLDTLLKFHRKKSPSLNLKLFHSSYVDVSNLYKNLT